jgi:hypothetical protein
VSSLRFATAVRIGWAVPNLRQTGAEFHQRRFLFVLIRVHSWLIRIPEHSWNSCLQKSPKN